jgi:hypothetical protein
MKILKTYEKFIRKENLNDIYDKYYKDIPFETFKQIVKSDPTSLIDGQLYLGKYCKWLLNLYSSNNLKLEDLYKVPDYLQLFDKQSVRNKLPLEKRNINNFKSLGELAEVISEFKPEDIMSKKEIKEDNLVKEFKNYKLYIPKDFKDSCILGKGTEWCTATEKTDKWFKIYHRPGRELLIFISKKNPKIKYQFHFRTQQFMDKYDNEINIHNFLKNNPDIDSWLKLNVKDYKRINNDSDSIRWKQSNFEGCPEIIEGDFSCSRNDLTSLEGCPKKIEGDFICSYNELTSLEGCPKTIEGKFNCVGNRLTSLEGCPKIIEGNFYCSINELKSLKDGPEIVEGSFICYRNYLKTLEDCPKIIESGIIIRDNHLTSLIGCPKTIGGNFDCSYNRLTSLEGCPEIIKGHFYCNANRLTNLKGCPKIVEGDFCCYKNPLLTEEDIEWLKQNCNIVGCLVD